MSDIKLNKVIGTITQAFNVLASQKDLSPRNALITEALTDLVQTLSADYSAQEERDILNDSRVTSIRPKMLKKLAIAEGQMEKYWAQHFIDKDDLSMQDLKEFWYWRNYEDLVGGEVPHIDAYAAGDDFKISANDNVDKGIAFVGAGPLPLTAIIMHEKTGLPITCIDNDPEACIQARALLKKLGLSNAISVYYQDGAKYDYKNHTHVVLASLVPNKQKVIQRVRHTAGQDVLLAVRSAERLHTLLYQPVNEAAAIFKTCNYLSKTQHNPEIINTTLFYEVPQSQTAKDAACLKCGTRKKARCRQAQFNF